jgi:uncharacterized protein
VRLNEATSLLRRELPDVRVVYVFGSQATSNANAESDVDIALLPSTKLDEVARWHLQEKLASLLGRNVDLVDLRSASTVMQKEIIASGQVVYQADEAERQGYEARVLSSYARLQEERREILNDVIKRGHVHD